MSPAKHEFSKTRVEQKVSSTKHEFSKTRVQRLLLLKPKFGQNLFCIFNICVCPAAHVLLFFCLDTKETKNQDCIKKAKNCRQA